MSCAPIEKVVQFGAGKIGRGLLGQIYSQSGCRVTFVDILPDLVGALRERGAYPLRLVDGDAVDTQTVRSVTALHAADSDAVYAALAEADIVGISVGVASLPAVAPVLARGLAERTQHGRATAIDVLLCENQWHGAAMMRQLVEPHIPQHASEYFRTQVGLVETVIGRMVPVPTAEALAEDPLLIVTEPFGELFIAREDLRGPEPDFAGAVVVDAIDAYKARKLLLHNMSHAALAYAGYRRGYETIWECLADADIESLCRRALAESSQALTKEYRFAYSSLHDYTNDLMRRFANRALGDTVARVAADPLRKLRPDDRIVAAADLCVKHRITPAALAEAIRDALHYDNPADPGAVQLQAMRAAQGDSAVLEQLCDIAPGSELARLVLGQPE